jgi:nicotinamide-nucleotide amidase
MTIMNAEIISIGSELVSGQNLDTNSQWLSQRLEALGIPVRYHTTLADDLEENVQALAVARGRAQLILITGGLGPTQDDLTRDALAKLAGVELVFDKSSFAYIEQLFASRNRVMPERNRVQALFPAGSEPIPNPRGTAPGIWMELLSTLLVAMPGVPSEMHVMFDEQVQPRLRQRFGVTGVVVERKLNCFGAGESHVEEKLLDLTRRGHDPEVGITVSDATISLRIRAHAADVATANARIEPVGALIRERLGDLVFGEGNEDLQHVVGRMLLEKRLTIATAESITGGLVAARLTEVPGISASLLGAVVAYDNRIKREVLGVPEEFLEQHGAVSAPVAEAMARGVRERLGVDLGVSTTGIAGPTGATPTKPVGLVFVGVASAAAVHSFKFQWWGNRQEIQSRTARMALNAVRLTLLRAE